MRHVGNLSRRTLLQSAGALAASIPVVAVAGQAKAATGSPTLTGVAEVLGTERSELLVQLRQGGRRLQVPATDFGDIPIAKGDLVAIMPSRPDGDVSRADSVSAYPYLRVGPDMTIWKFGADGESYAVGTHV